MASAASLCPAGAARQAATRDPDDLKAWPQLASAPGVGPATARLLLAAFGLPQQVLAQSVAALSSVVPKKHARAVLARPGVGLPALVGRTLAWLGTPGNHVVTLADDAFLARLFDLPDPPPLLYIKGDPALLSRPAVAMSARAARWKINLGPGPMIGPMPVPTAAPARSAAATPTPAAQPGSELSDFTHRSNPLLAALGYDPVTLDALCERSGQPPEAAATRLLELAGHAERLPGNQFRRLG